MIRVCRCHNTPHGNHSLDCIVVSNPPPYILYEVMVVHCLYLLIYGSPLVHVQTKATLKEMMWQTQRGVAHNTAMALMGRIMLFQLDDAANNCGSPCYRCQGVDTSSTPTGKPPPFASIGMNKATDRCKIDKRPLLCYH
jgi:hypothetical protein